jgi:hypothetical protein
LKRCGFGETRTPSLVPHGTYASETGCSVHKLSGLTKGQIMRNFIIGALLVALVAVTGFYFYKQNHITIEKPSLPHVSTN